MYGKNVPQSYYENIYNGNVKDEQEEYDLSIWCDTIRNKGRHIIRTRFSDGEFMENKRCLDKQDGRIAKWRMLGCTG